MLPLKIGFLFFRPKRTYELIDEKCEVTKGVAWMVFCYVCISILTSFIGSQRLDPFYFAFSTFTLMPSWLLSTHLTLFLAKKVGGSVDYAKYIEASAIAVTPYFVGTLIVTPLTYGSAGHFSVLLAIPLSILAIWIFAVGIILLKTLVKLSTRRSIAVYLVSMILFWIVYGISFNLYWYLA